VFPGGLEKFEDLFFSQQKNVPWTVHPHARFDREAGGQSVRENKLFGPAESCES